MTKTNENICSVHPEHDRLQTAVLCRSARCSFVSALPFGRSSSPFCKPRLIPDGSCSSGRADGPSVAHQSGSCLFYFIYLFIYFKTAFNVILTRVRGEVFQGTCERPWCPWTPMDPICRNLGGAVFVTLRAGKATATNEPQPPSQGQGGWVCQGSWNLDLLCPAPPFLCQDGSLPLQLQNNRGKSSLPSFPLLFLDVTTPRSLFLCGLTYRVNVKTDTSAFYQITPEAQYLRSSKSRVVEIFS